MRIKILAATVLLLLIAWHLSAQKKDTTALMLQAPMADYTAPKPYIVKDIKVHGVNYIDPEMPIISSGLVRGDTVYIPSKHLSQAISRLWSQRYYSDVELVADIEGDSVVLNILLKERPKVYNWLFEGVRKGEATTMLEDFKLKRGSELSDYVLDKNMLLIRKHYTEKGFLNVDVTPRIENDSVIQNAVNVTFVVDKGPRVKVGAVNFIGNDNFTDARLRRAMKKIHPKGIMFWQNSKLKDAEFAEDRENILDFYNSRGHRNAVILKDSIYDINEKRIGIDITVEEGNKYYFRDIKWVGNSKYETDQLNMLLGLKSGELYDKKTMNKRLGIGKEDNPEDASTVKSLYQNDGYLMSMVDPTEVIIGTDSIDLEIKIFEGKQFTINDVDISGNMRVNDEVIRREIYTRPGELYNRSLIMQTIRQLAQMGHFDETAISPNIVPVTNEMVNISWPLSEIASDKFEVSGGWGANTFVGSVGIQLNNISTRNLFKRNAWRPYPQGQNQQLSIRGQTNGTYYKALSLNFTEPWLGGKRPNSFTVGAYYSAESNAYYVWQKGTAFFRALGASAGIGRRLRWPDQYFTLYNEIGYQAYFLNNWTYFAINNGSSNIISFKTVFSRNSINFPIYPSQGSEFSLSLALTPPYSLFSKMDYDSASEEELYKWIEYHKWIGKVQWYYPLSSNNKLVLMARAEMGYLGHYNKHKLSPFEGFDVGGDGMSGYNVYGVDVIGLRGYEDGTLTPYSENNDYARLYNKYTVEVRYPFIMQPSSYIYGLVFAEGGNGYSSWRNFNPFTIKRSLGVGIRMYLPVVGMLGVDWGYGFDKPVNSTKVSGGQFHFMIGTQF